MIWLRNIRREPWRITIPAVGGLLVVILVAGLVGFTLNGSVVRATEVLRYDVALEDEGDDLRAAALDMRHYHRNIVFSGPSDDNIERFEERYRQLEEETRELAAVGVRYPGAPQVEEIRATVEAYYEDFRPAIKLYEDDKKAFEEASDRGLARIDEINGAGEDIDELGERLADASLAEVDRATKTARAVLLSAIVGLLLVGAALAYATVRVVDQLRRFYVGQQEASKRLAEASRAKTDFLADVSHELRTPLTVLRGNAQVGLALGAEGEQAQLLQEVVEESRRMTRMVEDLLFLARSDSSPALLERETVSAAPLASEIAGRAEMLAREHGAVLETDLRAEGTLRADPNRVSQAALTLVDNAIKYGPPGGTVTLRSDVARRSPTQPDELRITVADDGPGIPKEELPRVFGRFYRVDKARSRGMGGTGLGLPIAKTIVEAHGGHVTAESRPGKGTRITIHLPLLPVPDEGRSREGDAPKKGALPAGKGVRRRDQSPLD